jgi:hypothetical protein
MVAEVYFKLGILKEQMNDIMEQIRSCDDV